MTPNDESDAELLIRFAREKDERAFATLVERHLKLSYSVSQRILNNDTHLAEDIAQQVFNDVARNAKKLSGCQSLASWIFTSTRFAALKAIRSQQRRDRREKTAASIEEANRPATSALPWEELRPVIDEAISELKKVDRDVVLLRFFENLDYQTIGSRLSLSSNAARMRIDRALEKLQAILGRKGITSTTGALSAALGGYALSPVPSGLAATISLNAIKCSGTSMFGSAWSGLITQKIAIAIIAVAGSLLYYWQGKGEQKALLEDVADSYGLNESSEPEEVYMASGNHLDDLNQTLNDINKAFAARHSTGFVGRRYDIGELDTLPRAISRTKPEYPISQDGTKWEGEALVELTVGTDGWPIDLQVISATRPEFAKAALEAVIHWEFEPGKIDERPVTCLVHLPIRFRAQDSSI